MIGSFRMRRTTRMWCLPVPYTLMTVGFWVDVGAGDPVLDSVTAAFVRANTKNADGVQAHHRSRRAGRPVSTSLFTAPPPICGGRWGSRRSLR